ncbi:hypothetical protein EDEG_01294 [Edhazardia aedis USNM 41457]|uniref:Uncharacterized protein n=1 Tax=Edhazardia aedis (strain USNM 41457) TaxID=1003232 RepID=J9DT42_EDHAE|nr:hypothetical protein EDEG_01294 [Edhazardia aedis USNM 41457]|eukprot:EJW04477.1 hypothetical protein EDEG_01294 [Edhazardia aedis USNM 41457]
MFFLPFISYFFKILKAADENKDKETKTVSGCESMDPEDKKIPNINLYRDCYYYYCDEPIEYSFEKLELQTTSQNEDTKKECGGSDDLENPLVTKKAQEQRLKQYEEQIQYFIFDEEMDFDDEIEARQITQSAYTRRRG